MFSASVPLDGAIYLTYLAISDGECTRKTCFLLATYSSIHVCTNIYAKNMHKRETERVFLKLTVMAKSNYGYINYNYQYNHHF